MKLTCNTSIWKWIYENSYIWTAQERMNKWIILLQFKCMNFEIRIFTFISPPQRSCYDFTQWPAPSWLDSSIGRALHRYRRGHGFESRSSLNFFRLSFHNCLSCLCNCNDNSLIHFCNFFLLIIITITLLVFPWMAFKKLITMTNFSKILKLKNVLKSKLSKCIISHKLEYS